MAALQLSVGSTVLPGGVVELTRGDEMLWSDGTGRGASDGLLVGSVVARKQHWGIRWGVIPQSDYDAIRNALPPRFVTFRVQIDGSTVAEIAAYRSEINGEFLGVHGGTPYWKDVEVELIER